MSKDALIHLGAKIGADVPFFLYGNAALGEGTGNRLSYSTPLSDVYLIIINPGFPISTRWVYEQFNTNLLLTKNSDHIIMIKLFLEKKDFQQLGLYLHNDLEGVVLKRYPLVGEMKDRLLSAGALGAIMSGSGASVFGIFSELPLAEKAFNQIKRGDNEWKIFLTKPLG